MKKKAYICFDYDNDFELKECLVGQAKNPDSPLFALWAQRWECNKAYQCAYL